MTHRPRLQNYFPLITVRDLVRDVARGAAKAVLVIAAFAVYLYGIGTTLDAFKEWRDYLPGKQCQTAEATPLFEKGPVHEQFWRAARLNDKYGMEEAWKQSVLLPKGEKVLILSGEFEPRDIAGLDFKEAQLKLSYKKREVRVLSGAFAGKRGWVNRAFLKR